MQRENLKHAIGRWSNSDDPQASSTSFSSQSSSLMELQAALLFGDVRARGAEAILPAAQSVASEPRARFAMFGCGPASTTSNDVTTKAAGKQPRTSLRDILQARRDALSAKSSNTDKGGREDASGDEDELENVDEVADDAHAVPAASKHGAASCRGGKPKMGEDLMDAWMCGPHAAAVQVRRPPLEVPQNRSGKHARDAEDTIRPAEQGYAVGHVQPQRVTLAPSKSLEASLMDLDRRFLIARDITTGGRVVCVGDGEDTGRRSGLRLEAMLEEVCPVSTDSAADPHMFQQEAAPRGRRSDRMASSRQMNPTASSVQERLNREFEHWAGISHYLPQAPSESGGLRLEGQNGTHFPIIRADASSSSGSRDLLRGVIASLDVAFGVVVVVLVVEYADPALVAASRQMISVDGKVVVVLELAVYRNLHAGTGSRIVVGPCFTLPPTLSSRGLPIVMATYCVRDGAPGGGHEGGDRWSIEGRIEVQGRSGMQLQPYDPLADGPKGRMVGQGLHSHNNPILEDDRQPPVAGGYRESHQRIGEQSIAVMPDAACLEWHVPYDLVQSLVEAYSTWGVEAHDGATTICTAGPAMESDLQESHGDEYFPEET